MVRTIEQILGAQPLNQKVAAATPMYGAFTNKPDMHAVHRGAEPGPADRGRRHRAGLRPGHPGPDRRAAARPQAVRPTVPADEQAIAAAWEAWVGKQRTHRQRRAAPTTRTRSR